VSQENVEASRRIGWRGQSQNGEYDMAVGIRIGLPGVGVEEFDRIDAGVNARGDHPDGLIFSCSGPVDGGWRVLDVWGRVRSSTRS